ncbi:hypothetical protein TCAL_09364 [Tigriopus californicus]|uniref:Uncharacterized protein n=1 Tax=Tigriopus californicus TaxID=6832 RepID=A0A553PDV7_TIGCA|nr:hypothetical protein TCAL_09364 [Tigriopus californicus]
MSIFVVIEFLVGAFLFALFLLALWIVGKILRFIWYCTGFMCVAQSVPPRPINPNIPYRHNDRDVLAHDHPSGANRNPGPPLDPANRPMLVPGPRTPSPGWNNENDPLNQTYDSDEEPEPGLQANPEVNPQANPEVEDQGPHPNH